MTDDRDPIADFFARERAQITTLPGDDERWQAIVRQSRRGRRGRRSWLPYAAGLAAAASVAGIAGFALRDMLPGDPAVVAGATNSLPPLASGPIPTSPSPSAAELPTATSSEAHSSQTSSASTPPQQPTSASTGAVWPLPMVQNFALLSMSQASGRAVYALGTGLCSDHPCRVVVRSLDHGTTWQRVATLDDPKTSATVGAVGAAGSFTQIRMANEQVGWVFGDGLMQTTDGGRTFHAYSHVGASVLDVATDGTNVALVSSSGVCDGGTCSGPLLAQVAPVTASGAGETAAEMPAGRVDRASVDWLDGRAYVSARSDDDSVTPLVVTPEGKSSALDVGCELAPAQVFRAADGSAVFAACRVETKGANTAYAIQRSTDAGVTWAAVEGSRVTLPTDADIVSFAAADATHLIATAGSNATGSGALLTSSDSGRTWAAITNPALPEHGWRWAGAPGAGWYYLVPVDGQRSFWWGRQLGATWTQQSMN